MEQEALEKRLQEAESKLANMGRPRTIIKPKQASIVIPEDLKAACDDYVKLSKEAGIKYSFNKMVTSALTEFLDKHGLNSKP